MVQKVATSQAAKKTGWEEEWIKGFNECYSSQQYADKLGVDVRVIYNTACYLRSKGFTVEKRCGGARPRDWASILEAARKPAVEGRQLVDDDGNVRPKRKSGGAKK
jgi:hypothetical protein